MSAIRGREKLEDRIRTAVLALADLMDLGWLEVQLRFDESGGSRAVASASCDWQYRRIVITWDLTECSILKDEELERVAVHELCHALVEPIWDSHPNRDKDHVTKLGELVTENVARVVLHLLNGDG